MPVTIRPTSNRARLIQNAQRSPQNPRDMLHGAVGSKQSQRCLELLQSSFDDRLPPACKAAKNGFVQSVFDAYSHHHHLKIRPEDIWLAVLTQFSFYVNAHAEELRAHFVQHQGQKELEVKYDSGDRYSVDFADFAQQIGKLIEENVVDAELRSWLVPTFSTTTEHDVVVASITMMGTLQAYFSYGCTLLCGLPSVTLQGERSDYETILHKLDKLRQYGKETEDFAALLEPILRRFVRAFDDPGHAEILDFWNRIFSHHHMSSGDDYYSGWITAFCFWNSRGRRIGYQSREALDLDGAKYYNISSPDVPSGYLTVPVKVDDNGDEFDAEMVAGSVGMVCSSSGDEDEEGLVGLDTVEPMSGWWMYEKISAMAT